MCRHLRRTRRDHSAKLQLEHLEDRCLLSCQMFARDSTLFVIGDEAANDVTIVGSERGVQASCEDMSETFPGIAAVDMQLGDGDQFALDNQNGGLHGINFLIFSFDTVFTTKIDWSGPGDEGPEESITFVYGKLGIQYGNTLQLIGGARGEKFDLQPTMEAGSFQIGVTDIATDRLQATITAENVGVTTIKGGDGDDESHALGFLPTALSFFGQLGDDVLILDTFSGTEEISHLFPFHSSMYGGEGNDRLQIIGSPRDDRFDIQPGTERGSIDVGVTDIATGTATAQVHGTGLESVTSKAGDGNDESHVFGGDPTNVNISLFSEGGDDALVIEPGEFIERHESVEPLNYDGGEGDNTLQIVGTSRADRFDIQPTMEPGSFQVDVTGITTDRPLAQITAQNVRVATIKGGDGNDEFDVFGPLLTVLNLFGQGDDDTITVEFPDELPESFEGTLDGGEGNDKFILLASDAAELIEIVGVPDRTIPDPQIRVTDLATGVVTFHGFVMGTEEITVEAGDGDDQIVLDNRNGGLGGIHFDIMGQGGNSLYRMYEPILGAPGEPLGVALTGGDFGEDVLEIIGGSRSERFDVAQGTKPSSIEIGVTDIATDRLDGIITAENVTEATIKGGDGNDEFNVFGPLATVLNLFGQGGNDFGGGTANVGKPEPGKENWVNYFDGGEGHDTFMLRAPDSADLIEIVGVPDRTIPDPEIRVTDLATGVVTFHGFVMGTEAITVDARGGDDSIVVDQTGVGPGGGCLTALGGAGADTFTVLASPFAELTLDGGEDGDTSAIHVGRNDGFIQMRDSGRAGFDSVHLLGTSGADTFTLMLATDPSSLPVKWEGPDLNGTGTGVAIETIEIAHEGLELLDINAGGGGDTIDASLVPAGLHIQLLLRGGDGNDQIKGSAGADILLGEGGNDMLLGLDGRDLLIGGRGADRMSGNNGDDILIAGFTDYDTDLAALLSIMAEWNSAHDYNTRVANLMDGTGSRDRLNGQVFLNDRTVHDDLAADVLTGGGDRDWFFFNADGDGGPKDKVADVKKGEITTDIDP